MERRRRLVAEVGGEVEDMREELVRTVAGVGAGGQKRDAHGAASGSGGGKALPSPSTYGRLSPDGDGNGGEGDGDEYAAFEQQRQVEMMHEQDEALDGVFQTVGNLRRQANDMGRELEEQEEMLEDVDTLADRVGGKLQVGIKRVGWVIKKNEGLSVYVDHCFVGRQGESSAGPLTDEGRYDVELLHRRADPRPNPSPYPRSHPLRPKPPLTLQYQFHSAYSVARHIHILHPTNRPPSALRILRQSNCGR